MEDEWPRDEYGTTEVVSWTATADRRNYARSQMRWREEEHNLKTIKTIANIISIVCVAKRSQMGCIVTGVRHIHI